MKFLLFFNAEYINMITVSMLATSLFLGGWNGPGVAMFPWLGVIYFAVKILFFLFLYIWLRGTLPRFRFDQLMNFGWKFLMPLALINIFLTATIEAFGGFDLVRQSSPGSADRLKKTSAVQAASLSCRTWQPAYSTTN